jgi:anti-sigma regulatory factor (Ser/Thr protein kinase)
MSEINLENGFYKIRPAARLIHTIGSDLIGDSYAALVELVKNSYDADSKSVDVIFTYKEIDNIPALSIIIKDYGHGMSFDTVVNKWLVPATNDKLKRKISPSGRVFQGRKGIGRFAASILGQEMTIVTTDVSGEKSTAIIDWRVFNTDDYLENIELLVEKEETNDINGTFIEIISRDEIIIEDIDGVLKEKKDNKLSYWTKGNIEKLENELRKLISPFQEFSEDEFKINLSFVNCPFEEYNNKTFSIEAYPIIKLYDYKISGTIDKNGKGTLVYENNVDEIKHVEEIKVHFKLEKGGGYCGNIKVDFRLFDREPEAIENLINKGLIDPISNKYVGRNDAKRLLNEVYGVNIYRNDFRIRPYGNGGIDWLDLDKDRIQNSSLASNNQVVGFVLIESEEKSDLQEKSARDGLKENESYFGLKEISRKVLRELELRRLSYRNKTLKSRKGRTSIQKTLDDLFSFSELKDTLETKLNSLNITEENIQEITTIIKKEEDKKALLLEEIQKTIAIYQGQATLGKIVSFILHEGRKSIHFFRNESPVIKRYLKHYKASKDDELFDDINISLDGFEKHSASMSDLFKRLNPLASQSRGKKEDFNVKKCIDDAKQIFNQSILEDNIVFIFNCENDVSIYGWQNDLYIAVANLIENSIYWLDLSDTENKKIEIDVEQNGDSIIIVYKDNGPGLTKDEIQTEVIFEPGYSKKLDGTGLGLAIAGEAIERLNGQLIAHESVSGVYFQIEINKI